MTEMLILILVLAIGLLKSIGRVDLKEDNYSRFAQFSSSFVLFLEIGLYLFAFALVVTDLITQPIYCTPPYTLMTKQTSNPVLIIGVTLISLVVFFTVVKKLIATNSKINIYSMSLNIIGTFVIAVVAIDVLLCGYLFKNYVHIEWMIPLLRLVAVFPLTLIITYFEYRRKSKKYHFLVGGEKTHSEENGVEDKKTTNLAFVLATVTVLLTILLAIR